MTKGVKICITVAALIFVGAVVAMIIMYRQPTSDNVIIARDNEVLYQFDLSKTEDTSIHIEYTSGGYNDVEINGGKIRIIDADCPDKTCVKTGTLRSADIPIVCLPHHLVIRYSDEVDK